MHKMDNTPKIVTIIGLIFEFLGVIGSFFGGWILKNFDQFPMVSAETMEVTQAEFEEILELFAWFGGIVYGIAIVITVVLVFNVYLFVKLMKGDFSEESAKKVYLYQAVWGGINILFNQITGILYLVSGVTGYSGHKEERNIREGI